MKNDNTIYFLITPEVQRHIHDRAEELRALRLQERKPEPSLMDDMDLLHLDRVHIQNFTGCVRHLKNKHYNISELENNYLLLIPLHLKRGWKYTFNDLYLYAKDMMGDIMYDNFDYLGNLVKITRY